MYVNVAVLKETQPHERRVALVPSVAPKLIKLGAKLHMQTGAGDAIKLADAAFKDVVFIEDRRALVGDADVVLAVQPPALDVVDAMKEGAILICFIYADKEPALVQRLLEKKITCFAMERVPRITRAQAMDALSSQSALAGYYAVQLGATHLARILPKITTAAGAIGPAKVLVMGLGVAGLEASRPRIVWAPSSKAMTCARKPRNRRCLWAPNSSRPAWMPAARAAMRAN